MQDGQKPTGRTLGEIEADLREAEIAYVDADSRMKEAERNRRTALETINKNQVDFDGAVADMRQRSVPGSTWRATVDSHEDALVLQPEDVVPDRTGPLRPNLTSVSAEFDRLRLFAKAAGGEP